MSAPIERVCVKCGAEQGQPCVGARGHERKSFHRARGSRRPPHPIYATEGRLQTESPIEALLAGAILGWCDHHEIGFVTLATQAAIGPYRADILLTADGRKLVVECDGAAYHGSREQVARDKKRDRYCVARGIHVMRFSGAEITRNPRACAAEVGLWIKLR